MSDTKNYYEVIAKCGHVGRKKYIPIKFAVIAENGKEAAKIVRKIPRVKHNHKDAILYVKKICYEEYQEIIETNNKDPYLKCNSRHEQKQIDNLSERLKEDLHNQNTIIYNKKNRIDRISYKNKKSKILEKLLLEELHNVYTY